MFKQFLTIVLGVFLISMVIHRIYNHKFTDEKMITIIDISRIEKPSIINTVSKTYNVIDDEGHEYVLFDKAKSNSNIKYLANVLEIGETYEIKYYTAFSEDLPIITEITIAAGETR